jgi:hypothetical protein
VGRIEITVEQDEKDASTFCDPGGTEPGPPVYSADIDWKLSRDATTPDQTATILAPFLNTTVTVQMMALATDTDALTFEMDFGVVNPGVIGAWEAGEVVEASSSHRVPDAPAWSAWIPPA